MIKRILFLFMLLFSHLSVSAGVTELRLSTAQIFDVQWYISGGRLNASGFNYIYSSVNYATQTTSAARWTAAQTSDANSNGRYISFFNSTTNPGTYGMAVFNSNGTVYKIINNTGSFRAIADGAIFYNGNGMWGTLITTGAGYNNGQSGNWAVTQDYPSNAQLQAYTPPSSTPLAAGQTATTTQPSAPTVTSTTQSYTSRSVVTNGITYVYRTPTTTTNYSDGSSTTTSGTEALYQIVYPSYVTLGSGTAANMAFGSASPLTTTQQNKVSAWTNKTVGDGNQIHITQIGGDANTVTMEQHGNKNLINATLRGTNNTITANQGVAGIGQNEMKLNFEGNNNVVKLNQSRDTLGNPVGGNGHYLDATIAGWGTNLTVQQTNAGGVGGHYNETTVYGNGNNVTAKQTDNGNKIMFLKVDGALNTLDAVQKGTGQHRLDATLIGNSNNATVLQEGTIANNATLNLTNAGGPQTIDVKQTGGQSVSVTATCVTAGGCAPITVRQGY